MLNLFQPTLGAEELEAVRRVFKSNWVGKGGITDQFESNFAHYIGVERNLIRSVSCCTEGLFQSMVLLGIGPGDEVILPSISFVGAANAVASSGAKPVFCDVDKRTLNTTAKLIEEMITEKTKAVIILHYGGVPCRIDEICELVNQRRIALIEDVAGSVASRYEGKACGTFGHIGLWSFDAMKILVAGDGGMIYCRTAEMAQDAEELLHLGLLTKSGFKSSATTRWWEFEVSSYGRRATMNDIASAIGLEQLKKLPGFVTRRKQIHEYYDQAFSAYSWLQLPPERPAHMESSYYFYWIQVRSDIRDKLAIYLRERDIYTTFRYYPLHWVKFYGAQISLPNTEEAAEATLCIPIHQSLSNEDLDRVIKCVSDFGKGI
ncbi:DegT/DnrJ/EryC1/StrS family aminotransferase [Candidatus Thiosymbion oneisti]|uniref:DegT/DnrJ/EryC1/StrS family aminotransferase n=1 Tax=Candidatus Thiosymbion oneisti TaxID=589554 RepID=UPI000B7F2416|nr:DegT/DnrJ/EryC1/StrS family aminotransferase [Candidatus Thiosymbion oneisti]